MKIQIVREPIYHIIIDDILPETENKKIFDHIVGLKEHFNTSSIGAFAEVNTAYRSNLNVNMDQMYAITDQDDADIITEKRRSSPLLAFIDGFIQDEKWLSLLDAAPTPFHELRFCDYWTTQVSRYGEKDHYHWHYDRIPWDNTRILTLIYYVHSTPKKFNGGELYLSDGLLWEDQLVGASKEVAIEPKNNRLVLFDSRAVHTVKQTSSPENFSEGRFSVNVWIGRYDG